MIFKFLGTGAADYPKHSDIPGYRRYTSTLVDGNLMIDATDSVRDSIQESTGVDAVIYTHSHKDHFDAAFKEAFKPKSAYCEASWAEECGASPVTPMVAFEAAGFRILPVPSNHSTARENEKTLNYILEKDGERVLYATDGAWLTNAAYHAVKAGAPLDAAVFDGTVGDDYPNDWRVFEHNTLPMVRTMRLALLKAGLLKENAPVIVTHLARTLHPDHETLVRREAESGGKLIYAFDNMVFDTRKA